MSMLLYHLGIVKGYLLDKSAPAEVHAALEGLYRGAVGAACEAMAQGDDAQATTPRAETAPPCAAEEVELPPITCQALEKHQNQSAADLRENASPCGDGAPLFSGRHPDQEHSAPPAEEKIIPALGITEREFFTGEEEKNEEKLPSGKLEKKKRNISPEAREAAAQRMRDMHARKKAEREGVALTQENLEKAIEQVQALQEPKEAFYNPPREDTPPDKLIADHDEYIGEREDGTLNPDDWPAVQSMLRKGKREVHVAKAFRVTLEVAKKFCDDNLMREARESDSRRRA